MLGSLLESGRYELKMMLPTERRIEVLDIARPFMKPDPNAREMNDGIRGYRVHSLYLDTVRLDDYFERLEERRVRNRLRVRTYGNPGEGQPVFLENKRKVGHWVVKQRVGVCDADTWCSHDDPRPWTVLAAGVLGGERYAASSFCRLVDDGGRHPVSAVHYEREVLVPRIDDEQHVRLSLDRRVGISLAPNSRDLFAGVDVRMFPDDWLVMELKFDRVMPAWMRGLLSALGLRSGPISKYGLSVALAQRADHPQELTQLMPRTLRLAGTPAL